LPLLLCAARPAVAQDAPGDVEAARTSSLAEGLTLPQGAYRSTSRADIAKFADTLGTIARESEGSIGKVEVLVWRGGGDGPRKTISAFLSKAGYKLNERPAIKSGVSTITLFGAAQSVRTNNLLGMWVAQKDHLLLAWGAFVPDNGGGRKPRTDGAKPPPLPERKTTGKTTRNQRPRPPAAAARVSRLTGVALPKGAARQNDAALTSGLGRLVADGAKEFKLPARPGGPGSAEVFFWTGAAYKPGRAPFMRTLLENALAEAGYTYQLVDPAMDNTPNAFKDYEYGTGPLNLVPADARHLYFYGTSVKKGKTVVGAWFDQPSQNRLVLVLGEAGFAGAPAETRVPTVAGPDVWLVKNLKNATQGMPPAPLPAFPKMTPKPGTVRGMVKDGAGKPIAGAHLIAWASAAGRLPHLDRGTHERAGNLRDPAAGRHLPDRQRRLPRDLQRQNPAPAPAPRGRRARQLQLQGRPHRKLRAASERLGRPRRRQLRRAHAPADLQRATGQHGRGDAETRRAAVRRQPGPHARVPFPVKSPSPETFFGGIPIGRYTLTAKVYDGEDALPLRVRKTFRSGDDEDDPKARRFARRKLRLGKRRQPGLARPQRNQAVRGHASTIKGTGCRPRNRPESQRNADQSRRQLRKSRAHYDRKHAKRSHE
jgi:hypothetical protein